MRFFNLALEKLSEARNHKAENCSQLKGSGEGKKKTASEKGEGEQPLVKSQF